MVVSDRSTSRSTKQPQRLLGDPCRQVQKQEITFDPDDQSATVVMWVGMLPSGVDMKDKAGKATKGLSVNNIKNIDLIATDPLAMRVVCPRNRETATYYALTKYSKGIAGVVRRTTST